MTQSEFIVGMLKQNLQMAQMILGDFTDQDMLVRPAPGANHPAWQLGHLISSERWFVEMFKPGSMPALPAGFDQKYDPKTTSKVDDPSKFDSKQTLLELFAKVREGTCRVVAGMSQEELDKPSPEKIQRFAPTWGGVLAGQAMHTTKHVGQWQVARRKLGK